MVQGSSFPHGLCSTEPCRVRDLYMKLCPACYFSPLMLLVAIQNYTKEKKTETLENGYSFESTQRELSNEYQHDRVWMFYQRSLHSCALDEHSRYQYPWSPHCPFAAPIPHTVMYGRRWDLQALQLVSPAFIFPLDSLIRISGFHMIFTPFARRDLCV